VLLDVHGVRVTDFLDDGLGQQLTVTVVTDVLGGVTVLGVTGPVAYAAVRLVTAVRLITAITQRRQMPLALAGVRRLGFRLGNRVLLRVFSGERVSAQTERAQCVQQTLHRA